MDIHQSLTSVAQRCRRYDKFSVLCRTVCWASTTSQLLQLAGTIHRAPKSI